MKYFFIFLFFFVFAATALAAQPAGELPKFQPLQPVPEFVRPNIEHNINTPPKKALNGGDNIVVPLMDEQAKIQRQERAANSRKKKNFAATAIAVFLIAAIFYFGFKKNAQA